MPATSTTNLSSYQLSFWTRWFASKNRFHSFKCFDDNLVFIDGGGQQQHVYCLAVDPDIAIESGWFWDVLVVPLQNGEVLHFGGIKKSQSQQLQLALISHVSSHIKRFYQQFEPALKKAARDAKFLFTGQHYICHAIADQYLARYHYLSPGLKRNDCLRYLKPDVLQDYHQILPLLEHGHTQIAPLNKAFVEQQIRIFQTFFDQVESNPLTEQQRKACVIDEQHNLVLAGAGTGKTSTMIGRVGYLMNAGLAKPEQILMLAYARKAAEEMDERIRSKLAIQNLTVKTFHSLGKHIITRVEGVVPIIDKMAEDPELRTRFVDDQIQSLLQDNQYKSRLVTYFVRFTHPYKSQYDFNSLGAYNAYILENDIRTLQGELVKSYEECEIANFLYRQGVAYQYEANYQVNTSGPDYKVYQPDFYLPDYGIYLEHFAVNEENQTPPFIDQASYLEGMEWKRALHQKHHTQLIETYSYLKHQGRLTDVLSEKLLTAGVQFKPLPQNELLQQLNQLGRVSEFSMLMAQILGLFKSAYLSIKDLVNLAKGHEDNERMLAAAYLFEPLYEVYQQHLRDEASIDFEDMIGRAIEYVESGHYQSPYRYLLVDEFQDILASRARLLKALMTQQPESSLFCVGDDWQSIYRFTGSDVSLTQDFKNHFGATATSVLDKTFRFNNQIGEVASRFVTENPSQIKKQIRSHRTIEQNAVSLIKTDQDLVGIHAALDAINAKATKPSSVLLLARFSFKKPNIATLKRRYPQLTLQFLTVHASKGKLPKAEAFKYAEERRLFYVALTRARHHVYLITNGNNPSPFVRELIDNRYAITTDEFTGKGFKIS